MGDIIHNTEGVRQSGWEGRNEEENQETLFKRDDVTDVSMFYSVAVQYETLRDSPSSNSRGPSARQLSRSVTSGTL